MNKARTLSAFQIAVAIVTMHYGLGMLVGTGQDIVTQGPTGMIYAISTGIGTLAILFFTDFYWKKFVPIWDLFKNKYGEKASSLTAFLSGFWMIGVIASFILSGQGAGMVFGISPVSSTVILLGSIYVFSLFTYQWLSRVFTGMLIIGTFFLVISLSRVGFDWFFVAPIYFFSSLPGPSAEGLVSVLLSTVLLTAIGMDFHQFVVRAKTPNIAKKGIILAAVILLAISFAIGGLLLGSLKMIPATMNGVEAIPYILSLTGTRLLGSLGFIFVLPIIFVAVGSGSGLLKVVANAVKVCLRNKHTENKYFLNAAILMLAFVASLMSHSVIGLITAFYAIYVASVFIPFLVYLFEEHYQKSVVGKNMFQVILTGFISSTVIYIGGSTFLPKVFASPLAIIACGFIFCIIRIWQTLRT